VKICAHRWTAPTPPRLLPTGLPHAEVHHPPLCARHHPLQFLFTPKPIFPNPYPCRELATRNALPVRTTWAHTPYTDNHLPRSPSCAPNLPRSPSCHSCFSWFPLVPTRPTKPLCTDSSNATDSSPQIKQYTPF